MIKFENTDVMNFKGAFRGMRNPLNSWDKSDSGYKPVEMKPYDDVQIEYVIGPNDLDLAKRLIKAGSDHRKFLRQIFVSVDITAPLYWWKEFDTYKVGTVSNSCSTMHTITKKEFEIDDFSHEHLLKNEIDILMTIINTLNIERKSANSGIFNTDKRKSYWWQIIQLLPSSYNQRRTVTLNYENLRSIRNSDRKTHKLDEWRVDFMYWIDSLPYAEELLKE